MTKPGSRHRVPWRALLVVAIAGICCLVASPVLGGAAVPATGASPDGTAVMSPATPDEPAGTDVSDRAREAGSIVELYPNPPTHGDPGEFVTVDIPPGANLSAYALADDHTTVALSPERTNTTGMNITDAVVTDADALTGRVTFSTDPGLTAWLTDRTVAPLEADLQLADRGDTIRLQREGTVVDEVGYGRATEGEVYSVSADGWHPLGATDRPVVTAENGHVEVFALPDEPDRAVEFLESADRRVLLAGYTVSSQRVVDALLAAVERGVSVELLADGSPVGGMTGDEAAALSELHRGGVTVRVIDGDRARYRYHHAKYAVVDDRALVTTENWKPAGTGGKSSRGWAVIVDQEPVVEGLVETYRADTGWVDAVSWGDHEPTLVDGDRATGGHPGRFEADRLPVERTQLLLAPDNADRAVREVIADAARSIDLKQVTVGDRSFPLLQALLDAAARGVEVRVLLSSAWYVEAENEQLAAWLRDQASAADLPLSVRLAEPGETFEKVHAKGLVVDSEQTLVGSINWNNNSLRNNREVALLLAGEGPADYFGDVFEADWRSDGGADEGQELPLGLALAVLAGAVASVLAAKQLQFG